MTILQARIKRQARYTLFNGCGGLPFSSLKTALCITSINGAGANNENIIAETAIDAVLKYLSRAAGACNNFGLLMSPVPLIFVQYFSILLDSIDVL
ncbi:hypothetical protein MNV_1560011 [Candidatus Methanoperedens nitroreducens]|uniref:Uncharacterized protein n=1 Tax=Candidatus Methanoperedens nitratireducens TaxID=1392998 RepID=A0A284VLC6_9EURY|nr:hypothetical protein MNV_1560011 [Candidatus Methanoperedens nitroreducens]